VAVFTCDTVDGDYKYLKSFRPLNHESRDIGQFIDDDGTAFVIFEDRPFGFRIAKLSDDYLTVEKEMCLIPEHLEGGAVVHYNGLFYVIGSALTGWNPNPNKYATAKSLSGPWSEFKDIAPPETKTYGAQSTMMLKVAGSKTTTVIFMGDIWKPKTELLCNLEKGTMRAAVDGVEIARYTHAEPGERTNPEKRIIPGPIGMFRHGGGASEYKAIYVEANPKEDRLITVRVTPGK
jgi:hypothetical protein